MALDRDGRDELLCFFDELDRRPGSNRALARGVSEAIGSNEELVDALGCARSSSYLKLQVPLQLPMFIRPAR